ncbi:MAG: hypothetical protein ABH840_00215 [Nanoarchaeota archaeon]
MNKIASLGLAALLSFSGCNQKIEQPTQKTETSKKVEQVQKEVPKIEQTTIPKTIPKSPQIIQPKQSLDEMITSEEQTAYRNADVLSRQIPRNFEKETFGDYIVYHEKGITLANESKPDGSPQLNGKGRAVVIRSNTDLLAGYFNYSFPGKEEGILAKGDEAKDLWRIAYVASADLILLSTGKASFGYSKKEDKWKVMEINMTAFKTKEEVKKSVLHESSEEEMKITDLSKRPVRTKEASPEKISKYQAVVGRFFDVYTPKLQIKETITKLPVKSIDEIFKGEEEKIFNQARQVVFSLKNSSRHKSDGKTIYHSPSISFSGDKMSGSGNYLMRDNHSIIISSESSVSSDSYPSRQGRWGKRKSKQTPTKTETKTQTKTLKPEIRTPTETQTKTPKPDARNFLFVYGSKSITLINSKINVTYFNIENRGWAKREMNLKEIKQGNEAHIMEYISKGKDFENTDLDLMPVRARMIQMREIEKYTSLKQLIDKTYPSER